MEKRRKFKNVLTVITTILLLVVGISFGYYAAQVLFGGKGSAIEATTVKLDDIYFTYSGGLEFSGNDILPGRQMLSSIKLDIENANRLAVYDLVWEGTNELSIDLEYTVYKSALSSDEVDLVVNCEREQQYMNGYTLHRDVCEIDNLGLLGDPIYTGHIEKESAGTVLLAPNETIITDASNVTYYYYVVIEYPNKNTIQNADSGKKIIGEIKVQNSQESPDTSILAIYAEQSNGSYNMVDDIPANYIYNNNKSVCTNDATVSWDSYSNTLVTSGLTAAGAGCSLYFDLNPCEKAGTACSIIFENITTIKDVSDRSTLQHFATTLTSSNSPISKTLYSAEENGGISYYFAGNPTDNYVLFGGYYWRIIRINYDGTIRMIYAGKTASATGVNAQIDSTYYKYSNNINLAEYTGIKYTIGEAHGTSVNSTIYGILDEWYRNDLPADSKKFISENSYFCNDRSLSSTQKTSMGIGASTIKYAGYDRTYKTASALSSEVITFDCENELDLFTTSGASIGNKSLANPIGLITMDEANFAGGVYNTDNKNYYLYTGKGYWTMTPTSVTMSGGAFVGVVVSGGKLGQVLVNKDSYGVRPVINLRADADLQGSGTANDPYFIHEERYG